MCCRDFYYYGNKLFQSDFIGIIQPGSSLIGQLQFNLLNSSVALVGYYAAAFTIDKPWMGRRRMQVTPPPKHTQLCSSQPQVHEFLPTSFDPTLSSVFPSMRAALCTIDSCFGWRRRKSTASLLPPRICSDATIQSLQMQPKQCW
jgi:hypothetical protein